MVKTELQAWQLLLKKVNWHIAKYDLRGSSGLCSIVRDNSEDVQGDVRLAVEYQLKQRAAKLNTDLGSCLFSSGKRGMIERAKFCQRQIDRLTKAKTSKTTKTSAKRVQRSKKDTGTVGKATKAAGRSGRGASRKRSD